MQDAIIVLWLFLSVVGTLAALGLTLLYRKVLDAVQKSGQTTRAQQVSARGLMRTGVGRLVLHAVHALIGVAVLTQWDHMRDFSRWGLVFTATIQAGLTVSDLVDYFVIWSDKTHTHKEEKD